MSLSSRFRESRIERRAKNFVNSLDRSVLGSFASDKDALILELIVQLNGDTTSRAITELVSSNIELSMSNKGARAEMFFWLLRSGDKDLIYQARKAAVFDDSAAVQASRRFDVIADNPDMLVFFERGIWDTDFIRKCLDEGIDSQIASDLLAREVTV